MDRSDTHATIRAQGHGDKLDRLIAMLAEHRASLEEVVALSATPPNRIAAISLNSLGKRAKTLLARIDAALDRPCIGASSFGSLGDWGANGHGPRIADMLRSARFYASYEPVAPVIALGAGRIAA